MVRSTTSRIRMSSGSLPSWRRKGEGDYALLVWLPDMNPADFAEATADGSVLPAKVDAFLAEN